MFYWAIMDIKEQIKLLFEQGLGSRKIADKLNIQRWQVREYYYELGLTNRQPYKNESHLTEKICKDCLKTKNINEFTIRDDERNRIIYFTKCNVCLAKHYAIKAKKYRNNTVLWEKYLARQAERKRIAKLECEAKRKEKIDEINRLAELNKLQKKQEKEERKKLKQEENEKNVEVRKLQIKKYQKNYKREWIKRKKKIDPGFKIRCTISRMINRQLKVNNGSKQGESCLKYLLYTADQLKQHLESQFEPWMNWNNWSNYNSKTWKDEDQSTWTWQIDHIIPQSDLPYTSMEDENFQKCWALSNLRPYSAKQNIIDGTNRTRHKK